MEAERWRSVRAVLERALALPEAERAALLARECAGDDELRAEVEGLLGADSTEQRIEPPTGDELQRLLAPPEHERVVAGYMLERELGRGGMGTVYLARRETEGFVQRVALKLVRRGLDDAETIRRFRTERAVLAALQHERIARFLDGGATPDGQPWYAMEYVDGEPLDLWCDGQGLGTRARVALFLEVCEAVQHAHAKLVVHRDLKPANLLVARDGHVKLLDFGIAKLLDSGAAETLTGQRALTPAYASPEQLRGEPITIASDIYSLGIVLYELLTGVRPFASPSAIVARPEPERPSTAVQRAPATARAHLATGERLARELRGDLDTILLKALHAEPTRRYATVAALADDLQRHLAGRVVLARPDTASYRLRTFVRRNRLAVGLAATALAALVAGFAGTLSMYFEADAQAELARHRLSDVQAAQAAEARQRENAERRFADVRQLATKLLIEFRDTISDLPGTTAARELLVSTGLATLDLLAQEGGDDPGLRLDLARGYRLIADTRRSTNAGSRADPAGALETLEKGRALLEALGGGEAADRAVRLEYGRHLAERSSLLQSLGRSEEAGGELERSDDILTELAVEGFEPEESALRLTRTLILRATLASERGALEEARGYLTRASAWAQRASSANDPDASRAYALLTVRSALATLSRATGDNQAALEERLAIIESMNRLVELHPLSMSFRRRAAELAREVAMDLLHSGRADEAIAHADRARANLRELASFDASDDSIRDRLAAADEMAGQARHQADRPGEAVACFRAARAWREERRTRYPEDVQAREALGSVLCNEGLSEIASGATEAGRARVRAGLELLVAGVGSGPAFVTARRLLAGNHANYGKILVWAGRKDGEPAELRLDCLEEALVALAAARDDYAVLRAEAALLPSDAKALQRCEKLTTLAEGELEKLKAP